MNEVIPYATIINCETEDLIIKKHIEFFRYAIENYRHLIGWTWDICEEQQLQPGDLKKHYEPGINRGNVAYEAFCSQMERWLKNGTIKVGMSIHKK